MWEEGEDEDERRAERTDRRDECAEHRDRDADFPSNVTTRWEDPARDEECIAWTREFFDALAPHATGGTDVDFTSDPEGDQPTAFGENSDRLVALENEWDPDDRFGMNRNVEPTV